MDKKLIKKYLETMPFIKGVKDPIRLEILISKYLYDNKQILKFNSMSIVTGFFGLNLMIYIRFGYFENTYPNIWKIEGSLTKKLWSLLKYDTWRILISENNKIEIKDI